MVPTSVSRFSRKRGINGASSCRTIATQASGSEVGSGVAGASKGSSMGSREPANSAIRRSRFSLAIGLVRCMVQPASMLRWVSSLRAKAVRAMTGTSCSPWARSNSRMARVAV
ncbi:hypothetical protein D3C86_1765370 [compost metagenome]